MSPHRLALPKVENEWPVPPEDSPSLTPIHDPLHEGRNDNLVLHLPPGFHPLLHQASARPVNTASDKTETNIVSHLAISCMEQIIFVNRNTSRMARKEVFMVRGDVEVCQRTAL